MRLRSGHSGLLDYDKDDGGVRPVGYDNNQPPGDDETVSHGGSLVDETFCNLGVYCLKGLLQHPAGNIGSQTF